MQEFIDWYRSFLAQRGLERPTGQMLFRYRTTADEYKSLRNLFSKKLEGLAGLPWIFRSNAERSLFVLYASEWWRREYAGGAWRWTKIIESITSSQFNLDVIERTDAVEIGLRVWGHRPSLDGKKYLGAIVAQGGLPLQMIAQGDGAVTKLLVRGMRHAQLLGWDEDRLEQYFSAYQLDLVQHLREIEIFKLLASIVWTVLELRHEFKLSGATNPIEILDKVQPNWRERFPIAADDRSAEPLLTGLVQEASRVIKVVNTYPASISRTLVRNSEHVEFDLVMSIQLASTITLDAISSAFGVSPKSIPQTFSIELDGTQRSSIGMGRQLMGGQEASVMLSGKPRRLVNRDAQAEVLMVLRGLGSDLHAPTSLPGGDELDDGQPWIFVHRDSEYVLLDIGSCNIPDDVCFIAVPDHFSVQATTGYVKTIGTISKINQPRVLYEVQGNISTSDTNLTYQVKTSQNGSESMQMVWKGSRLPYRSSPYAVYLGLPSLYKLDLEGLLHPISPRDIDWVMPYKGGEVVPSIKTYQGPIDAWVKRNDVRQRRYRMVLIPTQAKVRFTSGTNETNPEIDFHGWGINELRTTEDLQLRLDLDSDKSKLTLNNPEVPPSTFNVAMKWPAVDHVLEIELPYPTTDGRFSIGYEGVLPNHSSVSIRKVSEIQLHVYDRNPDTPKRYVLTLELSDSKAPRTFQKVSIPVPLESNGFGQIRLFEIRSSIYDLLCQSDNLDARIALNLCVGQISLKTLFLTRYDAYLEREADSFGIPKDELSSYSLEISNGIKLRALPLLKSAESDIELPQIYSEGVPAGRWNAGLLSQENSPWLIYPANDSSLQIRPTIFTKSPFDPISVFNTHACPLAIAMSSTTQQDRDRMLRSVIADMAINFEHQSWNLVLHQHKYLEHLPLASLDYWRAFGRSHEASVAVLLKLVGDIPLLMQRMHDELGVIWELTPNDVLHKALLIFSSSISKQLNLEIGSESLRTFVASLFRKLGQGSTSLTTQIDLILFQGGFGTGERFASLIEEFKKTPQEVLQSLWKGQDSMLQRILLRAHSEDREWPYFGMTEQLLIALSKECNQECTQYLNDLGRNLIWNLGAITSTPARKNVKEDVANAPFLAALLVQLTGSSDSLDRNGLLAQLRQIRAFDSVWFDVATKAGGLIATLKTPTIPVKPRLQRAPRPN